MRVATIIQIQRAVDIQSRASRTMKRSHSTAVLVLSAWHAGDTGASWAFHDEVKAQLRHGRIEDSVQL